MFIFVLFILIATIRDSPEEGEEERIQDRVIAQIATDSRRAQH